MSAVYVALDVLQEAASRRWLLALAVVIALLLITLAFTLELQVVDGALAAVRFFGRQERMEIQAVDVALRPLFRGAAAVIFYCGLIFGVLACADFGPNLLAPGRIEHLLSLPVRRASLLIGTYAGVVGIGVVAALYAAGGVVLVLGVKTGVYAPQLLYAGLLGSLTFAAIYGAMLAASVFARSAAVSGSVGLALYVAGIVASYRYEIAPSFSSETSRILFELLSICLPPVSTVGELAMEIAGSGPINPAELARRMAGMVVFGLGMVALGTWRFEQADY